MKKSVTKEEWVSLFEGIGLSEGQMMKWHQLFEARHPAVHEEFLAWLGIPAEEIAAIRAQSQA